MSLSISLYQKQSGFFWEQNAEQEEVFWGNITHNLTEMADEAGIYQAMWRPEEIGIKTASELIPTLSAGLKELKSHPYIYKQFNPINGWGSYGVLVEFVEKYLKACEEFKDAKIEVSR